MKFFFSLFVPHLSFFWYLGKALLTLAFPHFFFHYHNIGIKHGFSCINIRQVPWEVLKTEDEGRGFQHLPRDLANVNALKNHVWSKASVFNTSHGTWWMLMHEKPCLIAIIAWKLKTFATFRVISCTILFRLFTDVARTLFPRTMLFLGQGSTHLVTAAIMCPWYEHIESCVAVH